MITGWDFSMSFPIQIACASGIIFPVTLFLITKLPRLTKKNPLQFLWSTVITTAAWLSALLLTIHYQTVDLESLWASFFLYCSLLLVYLEMWGLLSRGYTLGLLLTFYNSTTPLSTQEAASYYRGGEGLSWLLKHRFTGLKSAKMIQTRDDSVALTRRGSLTAYLYKLSLLIFGLRYSG